MSVKLLTEHHLEFVSLKGGCTGSSESTLVKIPHCWKSMSRLNYNSHSSNISWEGLFDDCNHSPMWPKSPTYIVYITLVMNVMKIVFIAFATNCDVKLITLYACSKENIL